MKSFGKTVYQGPVDLSPTIESIRSGELTPRATYENREQYLPIKPSGYYQEYEHPTPGFQNTAGPQRIIVGQNGEAFYSPDHYSTPPVNLHANSK